MQLETLINRVKKLKVNEQLIITTTIFNADYGEAKKMKAYAHFLKLCYGLDFTYELDWDTKTSTIIINPQN